ncbi:MAG TPA: hypothetical protein VM265_11265 [Sphingomicrobium sp.]|nr:hypothetical protein [Sphingomicrobium sp.]
MDWFNAVRYRWQLVAAVVGACLLLGLAYVALSPRIYNATARMLVDSTAPDPVNENRSKSSDDARTVMSTHADIMRTPALALAAAQLSGLTRDPFFLSQWQEKTSGRTPFSQWMAAEMLKALKVEPRRDTNVLLINAESDNPQIAARIANGFAQAAINTSYRLRTEPAKAYAAWLETRLEAARTDVTEKQKRLSQFSRATGITDGDLSSEGSQMASVASQLAAAEAEAAAARQNAFTGAQSVADAERSETVQRLRQQVAESSGKIAELESVFGPEYPDVRRTRAELATLRAQLNSETAKSRAAFEAARAAQAAAARAASGASEARLRAVANEQRSRVGSMGANLAQYMTLKNEFEGAQKSFNDINERLLKMRLQGNIPETEVKIVDIASAPLLPSSPKIGFVLGTALLLGLVLGVIAAIILESLDPRVRSGAVIERLLGVRVIGQIALPGAGSGRKLLPGPPRAALEH